MAQQIGYLAEKRLELKRNAGNTLEIVLQRVLDRYSGRRVFHRLRLNGVAQVRKAIIQARNKQMEKENIIPTRDIIREQNDLYRTKETAFNSTHGSKSKPFHERGTFSFNKMNKEHEKKQRIIDHQNYISQNINNYEMYQDKNFFSENEEEMNFFSNIAPKAEHLSAFEHQNQQVHHHKMQSNGSLQYSNTPKMTQRPIFVHQQQQQFQYDQIPISTKSNSISARNYTCTTSQSNEFKLLSQRQQDNQFYLSHNNHNSKSHHDLYTDINKYDSSTNIITSNPTDDSTMKDLEQKLREIRSGNMTTKNINKRHSDNSQRLSQNQIPNKINQFKNVVRHSYQNNRRSYKSSMQTNDSNIGYRHPSVIINNQDHMTLGQPSSQTVLQTHHTHKNSRVTNFEQINTDQASIITDITPIPNKNSSSHNFREDHSSISRIMDQNPHQSILTSNIMRSQDGRNPVQKSKEAQHFERKYKKSKEKYNALQTETFNQQAQNQTLQQQNTQLGEKVELLEKRFEQMQTELTKNLECNNNMQVLFKSSQQKQALSTIAYIDNKQQLLQLRNYLQKWKQQCVEHNNQKLKILNHSKFCQLKNSVKYFGAWVRYAITRKTRKEKRKIQKLQIKALRCVVRRILLIKQKKIFNFWRGPFMKTLMLDEVQRDMQFAHEQVKQMRNMVSFNKIDYILEKRIITLKAQAFNHLVLNEFSKRSFNAETSELLTQSKSFSATKQNRVTSPLIQNININTKQAIQYQQQQYQQTVLYPFISQYEEEKQTQKLPDYQQKSQMQRKQSMYIEGIEIIYNVLKRQNQNIKDDYFSIWKHQIMNMNEQQQQYDEEIDQEEFLQQQQVFYRQNSYPQQQNLYQPDQIFNNASGDLDTSQEMPQNLISNQNQHYQNNENMRAVGVNSNQQISLQEPCYYKTNEGYFFPNQQELLSPNKINQLKRLQLVEYSKSFSYQCYSQALSINSCTNLEFKHLIIFKQQQSEKNINLKVKKPNIKDSNL